MIERHLKGIEETVPAKNSGDSQFLEKSSSHSDYPIVSYVELYWTKIDSLFRSLNNSTNGAHSYVCLAQVDLEVVSNIPAEQAIGGTGVHYALKPHGFLMTIPGAAPEIGDPLLVGFRSRVDLCGLVRGI